MLSDFYKAEMKADLKLSHMQLREGTGDRLLERSVQSSLSASASSAAAKPEVWGIIARLNIAQGYPDAAKEALKKQVG